ncbi:MAG: CAP domain-containing protein [Pseudomonadota bacterium]
MSLRSFVFVAFAALALAGCASSNTQVASSGVAGQVVGVASKFGPVAIDRQLFLAELNAYRRSKGRQPVALHPGLNAAAQDMSIRTAKAGKLKIRAHTNGSLRRRVAKHGVRYWVAAENLAGNRQSSSEILQMWKGSRGHNRNMLIRDVTHVGIARVDNPNDRWQSYWTLILAQPREF